MKKMIVVAAAMLLACATSFAQFNFNLGYVNSVETTKVNSDKYASGLNGFTAGFGYALELADDFYFTPGVNYVFITGSSAENFGGVLSLKGDVTEQYVNIPMTLSYDFEISRGAKLFVFAGPTASLGLTSSTKVTANILGYAKDTKVDNYKDDDYKRFDVMVGGGAGLKLNDSYGIKVGYDYGLLNRSASTNAPTHRSQLTVALTYLF